MKKFLLLFITNSALAVFENLPPVNVKVIVEKYDATIDRGECIEIKNPFLEESEQ